MYHLQALLLFGDYLGSKFCPPLETPGLQVPARCIRHFYFFKIILLLDALQLLTLFAGTQTYLEPRLFLLIVFYNGTYSFT
jgi:hypothetical protein